MRKLGSFGIDDSSIQLRATFFRKLMTNVPASPLSSYEIQLMENIDTIKSIEKDYKDIKNTLLSLHERKLIPLRDSVFLLLDASEQDVVDEAIGILEASLQDNMVMDTAALLEAMKECTNGMRPMWMVSALGEEAEKPEEPRPRVLGQGLNLEAMRNFK